MDDKDDKMERFVDKAKHIAGQVVKHKWIQRAIAGVGVLGAAETGSRVISGESIVQALIGPGTSQAALDRRTYAPIVSRSGSLNPEGILITPTPTRTPVPGPTPTETPPPTTEGQPTLSPEEHYSRLNRVDSETINGVATNIWRTNSAPLWATFASPQLKTELARLIANNSSSLGSNSFTSADVVFVKDDRGDSPTGVFMGGFSVANKDASFVYAGIIGETRMGTKIIVYYGLALGLDPSDQTLISNRNWSMGVDIVRFSRDGRSSHNQIPPTQEEIDLLNREPIRVNP